MYCKVLRLLLIVFLYTIGLQNFCFAKATYYESPYTIIEECAEQSLACNNSVRISIGPNCEALIVPDMILEGSYPDMTDFMVQLWQGNRQIANPLTSAQFGLTIHAKVQRISTGNVCWGTLTISDKMAPGFLCPVDTIKITCDIDPASIPYPTASDNCDPNPQVNLVAKNIIKLGCEHTVTVRTFRAIDLWKNVSGNCKQIIEQKQIDLRFPDDISWTCEQYAAFPNIIAPDVLHPGILYNAVAIDQALLCCTGVKTGDDFPGIDPYQPNTNYWLDGEDLDVTLDPNYDDDIDNPLNDPNSMSCGTPSVEVDHKKHIYNLSTFVGCPYTNDCLTNPGGHTPNIIQVPKYQIPNSAGVPVNGLEDRDILELTGSGVPNVKDLNCSYAVTYADQRLEVCAGIDKHSGPVFKILRTWTVINMCNNQISQDVQIIKVLDRKGPTITFNDDDNGNNIPDEQENNEQYGDGDGYNDQLIANQFQSPQKPCGSNGLLDVPTFGDNCTGVDRVRVLTPYGEALPVYDGSGSLIGYRVPSPYLPKGVHEIIYEAWDKCDNYTQAIKRVEVVDGIPPVAICREYTQIGLSSDVATAVSADLFDEGSYDNCSSVYFKIRRMEKPDCPGLSKDRTHFNDEIHLCCTDVGDTVNVVLRVYDVDPGLGSVTQNQFRNNSNECMIQILVEEKVGPTCVPPADVWANCNDFPDNLDYNDVATLQQYFGAAIANDNCSADIEELSPTINLDMCGVGTISRRFRSRDNSGNVSLGACRQTIMLQAVHDYEILLPGDFQDECVAVTPPGLDSIERACDLLAVNVEERVFTASANGECRKILRTFRIINWCENDGSSAPTILSRRDLNNDGKVGDGHGGSNNPITGTNFNRLHTWVSNGTVMVLNNNPNITVPSTGHYEYVQHIVIFDNTAPTLTPPSNTEFCGGNDNSCKGDVDLAPNIDELCTSTTTAWDLDLGADGTYEISGTGDLTGSYSLGSHAVRFRVSDECGNTSELIIPFTIIDCKAPTPVCHNGLSINLMPSGMVELWASDFDASSYDYCHPLKFRVNRVVDITGDGFITPDDYQTNVPNFDSIQLTCGDIGLVNVQLWVGEVSNDTQNNWDFCVTYVEVSDHGNHCGGSKVALGGKIENEVGDFIEDAMVMLNTSDSIMTSNSGDYMFPNLLPLGDFTVTPEMNKGWHNGLSTYDVVLINKHILNVELLDSPYKLIAADLNNSGNISTLDAVVLRKLVLRVQMDVPQNKSWRFVDKNYVFPNPTDPFSIPYPEAISYNNLQLDELDANFIGVKIGDVNGDAIPNQLLGVDDRTFAEDLIFLSENRHASRGETVTMSIRHDELVAGFQFTLDYDERALRLLDIHDGFASHASNFNVLESEGLIATSFANTNNETGEFFKITFECLQDVELEKVININSAIVNSEAYLLDGTRMGVKVQFDEVVETPFELYQNLPNPATDETTIPFYLPKGDQVRLTLMDISGREISVMQGNFPKGKNQIKLDLRQIKTGGVYFYEIATSVEKARRKMLIIK